MDKILRYSITPAFTRMTTDEIKNYISLHTFRALFTARGNVSFTTSVKLEASEISGFRYPGEKDTDIKIVIKDWNHVRDQDCDKIVIMSDDEEILFNLYYKPSEFIHEYGGLFIKVSAQNN